MQLIDTEDFQLTIQPISRRVEGRGGPYLEWIDVEISLRTPGIQADGRWEVMPVELEAFKAQLQVMQSMLKPGQVAELSGVERYFKLFLEMAESGRIIGEWQFQPAFPDGACVTGHCAFDQSYLPGLIESVETLLVA